MSDKEKKNDTNALFVDLRDAAAIDSLHKQFPSKTYQEIKDAIGKYGPLREDIVYHLTRLTRPESRDEEAD